MHRPSQTTQCCLYTLNGICSSEKDAELHKSPSSCAQIADLCSTWFWRHRYECSKNKIAHAGTEIRVCMLCRMYRIVTNQGTRKVPRNWSMFNQIEMTLMWFSRDGSALQVSAGEQLGCGNFWGKRKKKETWSGMKQGWVLFYFLIQPRSCMQNSLSQIRLYQWSCNGSV